MTLPSSGILKFSDINVELGRASTSLISLDSASNGTYAAINNASANKPSGTNPDQVSEWYGYNHNATCYTLNYGSVSSLSDCSTSQFATAYTNCSTLTANSGCYVYNLSSCTNAFGSGYIQSGTDNFQLNSSGMVVATQAVGC